MSDHRRHSAEMGSHAVSMGTAMTARAAPRLYLVTPPLGDAGAIADDLADALNAADIAAVLLRLEDGDEAALIERIEALRILIQSNGAALLLDGHAGLVARARSRRRASDRHRGASRPRRPALKPKYIAGLRRARQPATTPCWLARSGADYVMFGEPDATAAGRASTRCSSASPGGRRS